MSLWVESWQATMPDIDFSTRGDWLRERLAAHLAGGVSVLCEEEDGRVVGFVTVDARSGHVDQLAVRRDRFGSGVATRLLAAAKAVADGALALEVNQENPRAVRFYMREGFRIIGEGEVGPTRRRTWLMRT